MLDGKEGDGLFGPVRHDAENLIQRSQYLLRMSGLKLNMARRAR